MLKAGSGEFLLAKMIKLGCWGFGSIIARLRDFHFMTQSPMAGATSLRRRRDRRWFIVLAGIVVLLTGGMLGLPYGLVRWRLLPLIGQGGNGRLEIGSWSAGWWSGLTLRDVRLIDPGGEELASASQIYSPLSWRQALSGRYRLGETTVEGLSVHLTVNADGTSNFGRITRDPSILDGDISGNITGKIAGMTIDLPGGVMIPKVEEGNIALGFDSVAKRLNDNIKLTMQGGGELAIHGEAISSQSISMSGLTVRSPAISGVVAGEVRWDVDAEKKGRVQGTLATEELAVDAGVFRGDTLRLHHVSLPVDLSWQSGMGGIDVKKMEISATEGKVEVAGEMSPQSLANLLHGAAPGEAGKVDLTVEAGDLGRIVGQLPHALNLAKGVRVTAGKLEEELAATWTADEVTFKSKADFAASGMNGEQAVALAPVTLAMEGRIKPVAGGLPGVAGLSALLTSQFMSLEAHADSLSSMQAKGKLNLDKLLEQAGQFLDVGKVTASGNGTFDLSASAANSTQPASVRAAINLEQFKIAGASGQVLVDEPRLSFTGSGQFNRAIAGGVAKLAFRLQSRSGVVDVAGDSVAALEATADLDLGKLRQQLLPFVDLSGLEAAGHAVLRGSTQSDLSKPAGPIAGKVAVALSGLHVTGIPAIGVINAENLSLETSGTAKRSGEGKVVEFMGVSSQLLVGTEAEPICRATAVGDVDLVASAMPRFEISRLEVDPARLRQVVPDWVGTRVGELPKDVFSATAAGSWVDKTLTLKGFSLKSPSNLISLQLAGKNPFIFRTAESGLPAASGTVTASADLGRLGPILGGAWASLQGRLDTTTTVALLSGGSQSIDTDFTIAHFTMPPYFTLRCRLIFRMRRWCGCMGRRRLMRPPRILRRWWRYRLDRHRLPMDIMS